MTGISLPLELVAPIVVCLGGWVLALAKKVHSMDQARIDGLKKDLRRALEHESQYRSATSAGELKTITRDEAERQTQRLVSIKKVAKKKNGAQAKALENMIAEVWSRMQQEGTS